MSRVRHVYAKPGEYIAVHRKKKSVSYTPSVGRSYSSPVNNPVESDKSSSNGCYKSVDKTVNWISIITRCIAAILGIEVGGSVDHNTMCQIMPLNSPPVKLDGLRFRDFFKWLSDSLKSVSSSAVSEEDNVQFGAFDWADLLGM